jgi:hypothetical protein
MFFQESEAIATENLDLRQTVEQVDNLLATIFNNAPLRPEDFAWKLDLDANQVIVVFEILTSCGVLRAESVVECRECQNLVSVPPLEQGEAQRCGFECSGCGCSVERSAPVVTFYRMTDETLARSKPTIATIDDESALGELDQYPSVFRRLGHYWVIKYDTELVLLHSTNGLSYLARLLVDPGRKIPAAFLLAAEMGIDPRIPVGSSGPVLDDKALAAYRKIYLEVTRDLDEAKRDNDHARIVELEKQKEVFSKEIVGATGLGGRTREKSDSERVRKNVTNAVARAIEAVAQEHERLGRHLRNSITSGSVFSYDPERDPQWLI